MSDAGLAEVMEQHPQLNSFGLGVFDPSGKPGRVRDAELAKGRAELAEREARVYEIVAWLRDNLRPIQTPRWDSYGLKHLVEDQLGYITNGELIAAALIVGYSYRYRTPNVEFGISARDIRRFKS